jgi:hypothetical protein
MCDLMQITKCKATMTDLDEVGTLSDSATLLRHNTTKRLPTPALYN